MTNNNNNKFVIVGMNDFNNQIRFEVGHTKEEWKLLCAKYHTGAPLEDVYWDFCIEDILTGAVEPDSDILYWLIDGRLYEVPNIY